MANFSYCIYGKPAPAVLLGRLAPLANYIYIYSERELESISHNSSASSDVRSPIRSSRGRSMTRTGAWRCCEDCSERVRQTGRRRGMRGGGGEGGKGKEGGGGGESRGV